MKLQHGRTLAHMDIKVRDADFAQIFITKCTSVPLCTLMWMNVPWMDAKVHKHGLVHLDIKEH